MDLSIVILAAGKGTRMKSDLPKVLHTLCGKSMLEYLVIQAQLLSDDITIVTYHKEELIKEHLSSYDVKFKTQDHINYPGTGGAMREIEAKYKKVLLLNGDMPLVTAKELQKFVHAMDTNIALGVIDIKDPQGYGRVLIKNSEVQSIVEQKDASKDELAITTINSGVYMFDRDILDMYLPKLSNNNAQNEYYITDIVALAKNDNKKITPIYVEEKSFMGVNSPLELANAEVIMGNKIKNNFMANGVTMRLPETIYIESDVEIDSSSTIENGVSLIGKTTIKNSHIKANTMIENSYVDSSSVGPLAHIRPKSIIKSTHIGNFVETKNTTLNDVKAGHLSYLGDADISSGTNIGAGTITCNYDGKGKYKTIIGKNVFIGSDTQLVAPVNIADDTIIAAGSTITKDTNKGDLAISRTKQANIKNFFYKFFGNK